MKKDGSESGEERVISNVKTVDMVVDCTYDFSHLIYCKAFG